MTNVLVVEDYPSIQKIYQIALTREGYNVTVAADGKEALELVATHSPDLILLDLLMPRVGGLEFLRRYNLADHPHTKVIVFSNLASPELSEEAKALGASLYLAKSRYTPKELIHEIEKLLGRPHEQTASK